MTVRCRRNATCRQRTGKRSSRATRPFSNKERDAASVRQYGRRSDHAERQCTGKQTRIAPPKPAWQSWTPRPPQDNNGKPHRCQTSQFHVPPCPSFPCLFGFHCSFPCEDFLVYFCVFFLSFPGMMKVPWRWTIHVLGVVFLACYRKTKDKAIGKLRSILLCGWEIHNFREGAKFAHDCSFFVLFITGRVHKTASISKINSKHRAILCKYPFSNTPLTKFLKMLKLISGAGG